MYHLQGQRGDSSSHAKVMNAFQSEGITYLEADWSSEDPKITEALEAMDVLVCPSIFFEKGSSTPNVLPQILTQDIVLVRYKVRPLNLQKSLTNFAEALPLITSTPS